jgi:superfamily II DNA helicase RecQ
MLPRNRILKKTPRRPRFVDADLHEPLTEAIQTLKELIQTRFRLTARDWQMCAIHAALKGHDVMIRAGTGSGKSLVFQAISLVKENAIVVVVSPINGLMDNQVDFPIVDETNLYSF